MSQNKTRRVCGLALAIAAVAALPVSQAFADDTANDTTQFSVTPGQLEFVTDPDVPTLPGLTLNGQSQTLNATMNDWSVRDATGSGAGWRLSVQGDGSAGNSAVFKEYCTDGSASNGCDTAVSGGAGPGYVTSSPKTLAANSLTLSSSSAGFTALNGTTGNAPSHTCPGALPCNLDSSSAVEVADAAVGAGMGTYQANGYGSSSLALAAPTTVSAIGTGNKVYRVDLTWTLATGP